MRDPAAVMVIVLAGALFLFAACTNENTSPSPNGQTQHVEQQDEQRTFNNWSIERVAFPRRVSIGDVMRLRIFNERIFVVDRAYFNVKRYALDGELEVVYGNGQGQGPGQFQNINAFWVGEDNGVWIVDLHSRQVSRFRPDGSFAKSFYTEFPPHRVAEVADDRLIFHMVSQEKVFAAVDTTGNVLRRFGEIIDEPQQTYTLALDAHVYPRPQPGFIWAPSYASYLYFYDPGGRLERRIELIDGHPFPIEKMEPNPTQASYRDVQWPHRTFGVSVTEDAIFVNVLENRSDATVVDRYDRETGEYIDSFRLPEGGGRYHVHDGMVYGEADTTLVKYRIQK